MSTMRVLRVYSHSVTLGLCMAAIMAATSLGAVKGLEGDLMTLLSVGSGLINGAAGVF
jgi:hypothetical protein